jgi:hypothetical protein
VKIETQIRVCTALQWVCIGLLVLCALAGCSTAPPRVEIQRVNVAVPVECKEQAPPRPGMPTESLHPGADVDQFAQAAMAEIERREGYEVQLRTALQSCISWQ